MTTQRQNDIKLGRIWHATGWMIKEPAKNGIRIFPVCYTRKRAWEEFVRYMDDMSISYWKKLGYKAVKVTITEA